LIQQLTPIEEIRVKLGGKMFKGKYAMYEKKYALGFFTGLIIASTLLLYYLIILLLCP
jgi:hypothetical protein